MERIRKGVAWAIGITCVFIAGGVALPSTKRVERSYVLDVPVTKAYGLAADLTNHPRWNARKKRDGTMAFSFSDKPSGRGAEYTWTSGGDKGRCVVVEAKENALLRLQVSIEGKGGGEAIWRFSDVGGRTEIVRSFTLGIPIPVLGPWILLFIDLEGTQGADFDAEMRTFAALAGGAVNPE